MSILAILEQRAGAWHRTSWETLAAAQQLGAELQQPVSAAVVGNDVSAAAGELAGKRLERVHAVEHDLLKEYTPDGYSAALRQLIALVKPRVVLFPHTYQVRDFAPKLATTLERVLVSDVVAHRVEGGELVLVRQLFQGKLNVNVRFAGEPPYFASVQAGAYRADKVEAGSATIEKFTPEISAGTIRTKPIASSDFQAAPLLTRVPRRRAVSAWL